MDTLFEYIIKKHKESCSPWKYGEPVVCWFNNDNIRCVEYEDGSIWKYVITKSGHIIWWK